MNKKIVLPKQKKKIKWLLGSQNDDNNDKFPTSSLLEVKGNKTLCLEGCYGVGEYSDKILKLKLKRGYITLYGSGFLITYFENRTITVKGKISTIEFTS